MTVLAPCTLMRAETFEKVPARIIELTPDVARERIDALWWNYDGLGIQEREGDQHWKWEQIALVCSNDLMSASVAVLSGEDYLEGAPINSGKART